MSASVSVLRDLAGLYGDAVIATLVLAVVALFSLLVRAQREHLADARAFGAAAAQLGSTIESNTRTIQSAVATLDEASDMLRVAYELAGRRRRREPTPPAAGSST